MKRPRLYDANRSSNFSLVIFAVKKSHAPINAPDSPPSTFGEEQVFRNVGYT